MTSQTPTVYKSARRAGQAHFTQTAQGTGRRSLLPGQIQVPTMPGVRFRLVNLLCWRRPHRRRSVTELEAELQWEKRLRQCLQEQLYEETKRSKYLLDQLIKKDTELEEKVELLGVQEIVLKEKDTIAKKLKKTERKLVKERQAHRELEESLKVQQEKWMEERKAMIGEQERISSKFQELEELRKKEEEKKEVKQNIMAFIEENQVEPPAGAAAGASDAAAGGRPEEEMTEVEGEDLEPASCSG